MKISCAVNAWNEASTIDLCLKSLQGFADEVIILDSGSIDGTPKIAQSCLEELGLSGEVKEVRAKTYFKFRLESINSCVGDWVLIQNSTTILSDALKKEFVNHMNTGKKGFVDVKSLNLMGDYAHFFGNRPFMAYHRMLAPRNAEFGSSICEPVYKGRGRAAVNWAVNLSRVRPSWRSWYRGEPFDRRHYDGSSWKHEANRQRRWIESRKYYDLIEYTEGEEGLTLEDVKRVAPSWYLRQLQLEATPLTPHLRQGLPEVIEEELRNPRYRLIKKGGMIIGREPSL